MKVTQEYFDNNIHNNKYQHILNANVYISIYEIDANYFYSVINKKKLYNPTFVIQLFLLPSYMFMNIIIVINIHVSPY